MYVSLAVEFRLSSTVLNIREGSVFDISVLVFGDSLETKIVEVFTVDGSAIGILHRR